MTSPTSLYVSIAAVIALGGCHLLGGADDLDFDVPPSGSGASGAGGPGTGGHTGGEGGSGGCACGECGPCVDEACVPLAAGEVCNGGLCDGAGVCAVGDIQWSRRFGSTGTDEVRGIALGPDGTVALGGTYLGNTFVLPGPSMVDLEDTVTKRAFVAQVDSITGEGVSAFALGGNGTQTVSALDATATQIFVAGIFSAGTVQAGGSTTVPASGFDGYVVGLDASEGPVVAEWLLAISATEAVNLLDLGASGATADVAIVGSTASNATLQTVLPQAMPLTSPRESGFIAVVSQAGNFKPMHRWAAALQHTGTNGASAVRGASYTKDGTLWVVGDYRDAWSLPHSGILPDKNARVGFIAKYAAGSEPQRLCSNTFNSTKTDDSDDHTVHAVAATPDGGAAIVGTFATSVQLTPNSEVFTNAGGEADLFIAKLSDCSVVEWEVSIPDAVALALDRLPSVASDEHGNVIVTAPFSQAIELDGKPYATMDTDAFVAKFAADGKRLWHVVSEVTGTESAHAVATFPNGGVLVGGSSEDALWQSIDTVPGGTNSFITLFNP